MRWLRGALLVPPAIALAGALGWAGLALWFDGPAARPLAGALAAGVVVGALALLILVRPMRRALGVVLVLWLAVLGCWLRIPPRPDLELNHDLDRIVPADI